ncbi:hypothetical protein EVAR_34580_1 [Eumeta japonica]|uniref:Uncharacterized protein n=1 Tax=Eumeta variegata TaxID=151549 RepID=A0A4C1ZC27_EUMVA|nr:hypothetical protein EVAR_34580_1 [Eumeta japonica]
MPASWIIKDYLMAKKWPDAGGVGIEWGDAVEPPELTFTGRKTTAEAATSLSGSAMPLVSGAKIKSPPANITETPNSKDKSSGITKF